MDQNQNNLEDQSDQNNKSSLTFWAVVLFVLILLAVIVGGFLLLKPTGNKNTQQTMQVPTPTAILNKPVATPVPSQAPLTNQQIQNNLLNQVNVGAIKTGAASSLPTELQGLVVDGAKNVVIKKASFNSGSQTGFVVTYSLENDLETSVNVLTGDGAETVKSKRGDTAAIMAQKLGTYSVDISLTFQSGQNTAVSLNVYK